MQHPFITSLADKTMEELESSITDLTKKLTFVYRMQNQPMIQQINMALDSYKTEYAKRIDALYKKQNLGSKIKISKDNE